MKVGDLVKLSHFAGGTMSLLRGIILEIYLDPLDDNPAWKASVLWTDGDKTEEFPIDLEVVCK